MSNGWIGVDLDGTLAEYHGWPTNGGIGAPIPKMVERVKQWLAEGRKVRIFTARVWPLGTNSQLRDRAVEDRAIDQMCNIIDWCHENIGRSLPVTCVKDYEMIELWDDRAKAGGNEY